MIRPRTDIVFVDLERVACGPAAIDLGLLRGAARAAMVRHPGVSDNAVEFADTAIEKYQPPPNTRLRARDRLACIDRSCEPSTTRRAASRSRLGGQRRHPARHGPHRTRQLTCHMTPSTAAWMHEWPRSAPHPPGPGPSPTAPATGSSTRNAVASRPSIQPTIHDSPASPPPEGRPTAHRLSLPATSRDPEQGVVHQIVRPSRAASLVQNHELLARATGYHTPAVIDCSTTAESTSKQSAAPACTTASASAPAFPSTKSSPRSQPSMPQWCQPTRSRSQRRILRHDG